MKALFISLLFSFNLFALDDPTVTVEYKMEFKKQVDILFVIDSSGSMHNHQERLGVISKSFINGLENVDYNIMAISHDLNEEIPATIIRPNLNAGNELDALITGMGTNGDATEYIFKRILQFKVKLTPIEFLRKNTNLEIITLTDEREQSEMSAYDLIGIFTERRMTFNAIIPTPINNGNCTYNHNNEIYLSFNNIVQLTKGNMINLCASDIDFYSRYHELAKDISQRASDVATMPIAKHTIKEDIDFNSIKVFFGNQEIQRGMIDTGWVFNETENAIYFGQDIVLTEQTEGTKLTIQYEVL
jgi:hypothetical protein